MDPLSIRNLLRFKAQDAVMFDVILKDGLHVDLIQDQVQIVSSTGV